jgi:hypothetical protein
VKLSQSRTALHGLNGGWAGSLASLTGSVTATAGSTLTLGPVPVDVSQGRYLVVSIIQSGNGPSNFSPDAYNLSITVMKQPFGTPKHPVTSTAPEHNGRKLSSPTIHDLINKRVQLKTLYNGK